MNKITSQAFGMKLIAQWQLVGRDIIVLVTGGEILHLGAIAIAEPRLSLANPMELSASISVFCYSGHKEDELVKELAYKLAVCLGVKVIVTAGIHWDSLNFVKIEHIRANYKRLGGLLLKILV